MANRIGTNNFFKSAFDNLVQARMNQANYHVKSHLLSLSDDQLSGFGLTRQQVKSNTHVGQLFKG